MSTPYKQDYRDVKLTTPLGEDKLVVMKLDIDEALSELFEFRIEALCLQDHDAALNFDPALGETCTLRIKTVSQPDRYFAGTLTEARRMGPHLGGVVYELILRPWFWMLGKRTNSRIFHNKTVIDIIKAIFDEHGFTQFKDQTSKSFPEMEYCVQHRETDLDFLLRLMERYGISYYFAYDDGEQNLVLAAIRQSFEDVAGKTRNFNPDVEGYGPRSEYVYRWISERRFTTGKVTLNDYNHEQSTADLKVSKNGGASHSRSDLELYDHPAGYRESGDGDKLAEPRINSLRATDERSLAEGNCASFSPGYVFSLAEHQAAGEYLIVRCSHHFEVEEYRSTAAPEGGDGYRGRYEMMKADTPFAPPMITPLPFIGGVQTAIVVGDPEINTDEQGRIKVHFHWNRESKGKEEHETMWCRVAHVWAGGQWGAQFIPRRDMEVLVSFVDGDPDRPVIVGTVYNDKNEMPYKPDESPTQETSGWKTQIVDKPSGYNELAFVDKDGAELIRMHAERNLEADVKNDVRVTAEHQITLEVGQSKIIMTQEKIEILALNIEITAVLDLKTNGGLTATHLSGGTLSIVAPMVKINC